MSYWSVPGLTRVARDPSRASPLDRASPVCAHQVALEFHRNRHTAAAGITSAYAELRPLATELAKAVKNFGGGTGRYEATAQAMRDLCDPVLRQLNDGLATLEREDPHRIGWSCPGAAFVRDPAQATSSQRGEVPAAS